MFKNPVFTVFYQKLLATRIYRNKNIANSQPTFQGQIKADQPRYYTLVSIITRTKFQKWAWWSCKHIETYVVKYYYSIAKPS